MSKIKLLLDVVEDLRSLADSVQAVADAMMQGDAPAPVQDTASEAPKEHPETAAEEPAKQIALEEVRAVLAEKSRSGHTTAIKSLLQKHGADKLSEIDPAEYPALLAEVEVL